MWSKTFIQRRLFASSVNTIQSSFYRSHRRFASNTKSASSSSLGPDSLTISIIGPPNAGKSTLFNRLLCKESNQAYRLTTEKKRKFRKRVSSGRIGASRNVKGNTGGAIVSGLAGTTRDRRESIGRIGPVLFRMVDTAGVDGDRLESYFRMNRSSRKKKGLLGGSLESQMIEQTLLAVRQSDLILFMFDGKVGVTADLTEVSRWLRKQGCQPYNRDDENEEMSMLQPKVLMLANKLEGDMWADFFDVTNTNIITNLHEAERVGFGTALPISAVHGEGLAELAVIMDEVRELKAKRLSASTTNVSENNDVAEEESERPLQLAILGRQNVGKSTLVNSLLKAHRVITGSTPGLTRDAITVEWNWNKRPVKIVDTAGIRKISQRVRDHEVEDLAVLDAMRAMKKADVAVLVLDAGAGMLQRQELVIADNVVKEGRSLVVVANKWDLLEETSRKDYAQGVSEQIELRLPMLRRTPVVAMSTLNGEGVELLMPIVFNARDRWERVISTGMLNRWLLEIVDRHPPPLTKGRPTKIKYIVQSKGRPPTFLLFANVEELPTAYLRFLVKQFQESFQMFGMEVRFSIKRSTAENPYHTPSSNRSGSGIGGSTARKERKQAMLIAGLNPKSKNKRKRKRRLKPRVQRIF